MAQAQEMGNFFDRNKSPFAFLSYWLNNCIFLTLQLPNGARHEYRIEEMDKFDYLLPHNFDFATDANVR